MQVNPRDEPSPVTDEERELFDGVLDRVVAELPPHIRALLEEIPLIAEDYPSDEVLDEMGIEDPGDLCGLHSGIPLTQRSVEHSGHMPDTIHVYREGILNESLDDEGYIDERALMRQVRITVLHEIGHHFGLDEEDLRKLGYA